MDLQINNKPAYTPIGIHMWSLREITFHNVLRVSVCECKSCALFNELPALHLLPITQIVHKARTFILFWGIYHTIFANLTRTIYFAIFGSGASGHCWMHSIKKFAPLPVSSPTTFFLSDLCSNRCAVVQQMRIARPICAIFDNWSLAQWHVFIVN